MDKFKKSQILKLFLMAILLSITPLLSTSLRPPYLYFVLNILIIALGAEAGLLSFIVKAAEAKKTATIVTQKPQMITSEDTGSHKEKSDHPTKEMAQSEETQIKKKTKVVEKSSSEKIVTSVKVHKTVKMSPSRPSLFFIGGGDHETEIEEFTDDDDDHHHHQEPVVDDLSGQELFHKAETFIGNFYKQLKMQREDSWKKLHGLYQKAF